MGPASQARGGLAGLPPGRAGCGRSAGRGARVCGRRRGRVQGARTKGVTGPYEAAARSPVEYGPGIRPGGGERGRAAARGRRGSCRAARAAPCGGGRALRRRRRPPVAART
ncbi:hypothetical protein STTU_2603 [Streptomyces sp. Tu6071]|nr:hypothetical protein STTU_2603 [Streptomyces sp. Tu6071]